MSPSFRRGTRASLPLAPTFFAIFAGVGIAGAKIGVEPITLLFLTVTVWAAPAQFAAFDLAAQGAPLFAVIVTASLANLRFVVMSLALAEMFRGVSRVRLLLWAPFVAATPFLLTWFEHRRQIEKRGEGPVGPQTFDYYRGVGAGMMLPLLFGVMAGAFAGNGLPPEVAFGATLFYPVYFSLLIRQDLKGGEEILSVIGGIVAAPVVEQILPGWGVVVAGSLVGAAVTLRENRA